MILKTAKPTSYTTRQDGPGFGIFEKLCSEDTNNTKPGCHSRFKTAEELIIAHEVAAARGNMAGSGEVRKLLSEDAQKMKENSKIEHKFIWKIFKADTSACKTGSTRVKMNH